jgi:hypothetical protein
MPPLWNPGEAHSSNAITSGGTIFVKKQKTPLTTAFIKSKKLRVFPGVFLFISML